MNVDGERLQKVLARAGYGSRRASELLIEDGRVRVDGTPAVLGQRVGPNQEITVDGARVVDDHSLVHYLLNKPRGVVSTAADPQGRQTVIELVPAEPRVFSVGRLDTDTTGLLLLTNDGDLAQRITHPKYGIKKRYVAEVAGRPSDATLRRWEHGVDLEDGQTAPAALKLLAAQPNSTLLQITVHEGRNRLIRRVAEHLGHPVISLARIAIGPIADPSLKLGAWRPLQPLEVIALRTATADDELPG